MRNHHSNKVYLLRVLTVCITALAPTPLMAAVLINEVAWMGTTAGPNEEWIELYNSGDTEVPLEGWTLTDNVSVTIPLSGILGAGAYGVLERTDDTTIEGTAFLIYTGALSNDGRTLTLRRSDNSIEDQVAGGEGWSDIGGDNVTKDTAQRTQSGWITAPPTPGRVNATVSTGEQEDDDAEPTATLRRSSSNTVAVKKRYSDEELARMSGEDVLRIEVEAPEEVYVNQQVSFTPVSSGLGKTILQSLTYRWNFGDSYTATGTQVSHRFRYPGKYLVFVEGQYREHHTVARHEVTVLPVTVSLSTNTKGDVLVHNDAPYEVDISTYILRGDTSFVFPKDTVLLPKASLTIERSRLGRQRTTPLMLSDEQGVMVSQFPDVQKAEQSLASLGVVSSERASVARRAPQSEDPPRVAKDETPPNLTPLALLSTATPMIIPVGTLAAAAGEAPTDTEFTERLPYLGLVLVILLAFLLTYRKQGNREM